MLGDSPKAPRVLLGVVFDLLFVNLTFFVLPDVTPVLESLRWLELWLGS